jgi:PAS domain S-box-containing protein
MYELLKILIVEDLPEDADLIMRQLKKDKQSYSFFNVSTADEFKTALRDFAPHVVLSDHTLPQFSSWEALRLARQHDPHLPFILVTGTVSEEFAVEILHAGADDYILKSSLTRLSKAIGNALQRRKSERENQRMVEELKKSEERLAAFMNNSPAMQWIIDPGGRFLFANRALLSRMNISPETAEDITSLIPLEVRSRIEHIVQTVKATRTPVESIEKFIGTDGKPIYLLLCKFPMLNDHVGGIAIDITAQKLAEEKLLAINEEMNTFIYKASHDLKGPLSSIMGLAALVKAELADHKTAKYIEMISESTQKLDKILLGLIEVMSARRHESRYEPVDLRELITEVMRSLEFMPGFSRMNFNLDINTRGTLYSDRSSLTSIFQNMIENAVKYQDHSAPRSLLDIRIDQADRGIRIEFSDNGVGISNDIRDRIFDMFFRGNDDSKGSGLGLYIVKNTVEKLGGTISLENGKPKGTTFVIWLPGSTTHA